MNNGIGFEAVGHGVDEAGKPWTTDLSTTTDSADGKYGAAFSRLNW